MKLTLDRLDLRTEFGNLNCSQTKYEHFNLDAQAAIRVVKRATFVEHDGRSYNAIYPPASPEQVNDPAKAAVDAYNAKCVEIMEKHGLNARPTDFMLLEIIRAAYADLVSALEEISALSATWQGRSEAPFWNLGDIANATLKRYRAVVSEAERNEPTWSNAISDAAALLNATRDSGPMTADRMTKDEFITKWAVSADPDFPNDLDVLIGSVCADLVIAADELAKALEAIDRGFADGSIAFTKRRRSDDDPYHPTNTMMSKALTAYRALAKGDSNVR